MDENKLKDEMLLDRIADAKKSDDLFKKNAKLQEQSLLRPRPKQFSTPISSENKNFIKPNGENHLTEKSEKTASEDKMVVIRPRKKSQQNHTIVNVQKEEIAQTINDAKQNWKEIDRIKKREEKQLLKERAQIEKKVNKLQSRIEKMATRDNFSEELTHTLEVQDNYVAAMQQINQHIMQIKTIDEPGMSLEERRKKIYENSKLAQTERAQRLMYIRKLEASGKSLNRAKSARGNNQSFYQKQLEQQQHNEYLLKRNPYQKRLQEINERGGITVEETMPIQDRIADRWNAKKGNYDRNGKLKVQNHFDFPEEGDK